MPSCNSFIEIVRISALSLVGRVAIFGGLFLGWANSHAQTNHQIEPVQNELTPREQLDLPPVGDLLLESLDRASAVFPAVIFEIEVLGSTIPRLEEALVEEALKKKEEVSSEERLWSMSDVLELRDRLTLICIESGYLNSGAVMDWSDASNGVLTAKIVEGRLTRIVTHLDSKHLGEDEGSERGWRPFRLRRSFVENLVWPNESIVLNQVNLQERFQLAASDQAIRKLKANLIPGDVPGEAILDLTVDPADVFWVYTSLASERSPSIGGERLSVGGGVRNILGFGDTLAFQLGKTEGLDDAAIQYSTPLGTTPFHIAVSGDIGDAQIVEDSLKDLEILSKSESFRAALSYDFTNGVKLNCKRRLTEIVNCPQLEITSSEYRIRGTVGVQQKQTESELLNVPFSFSPGAVNGRTENTTLDFSIDGSVRSNRDLFAWGLAFVQGIDAIEPVSPDAPGEDFSVFRAQGQYARQMDDRGAYQLAFRGNVQYAPQSLLVSEKIAFGGSDSVRGYRKNAIISDNAVVGSVELQAELEELTEIQLPEFVDSLSLGVFAEGGYGWGNESSSLLDDTLASIGVAVNFGLSERLSGSVYYGHKLVDTREPRDKGLQDTGLGFRLRVNIAEW